MKTLTFILCLLTLSAGATATEVNEEVKKIFSKTYPEAKSISWEELKEGYKVFFTRNNVSFRIMYDASGNIVRSLKYYGEDNLPPLILNKVQKSYKDFKVHSVVEESTEQALTYHIILENDKKIINITSDPIGSLQVQTKFNKG